MNEVLDVERIIGDGNFAVVYLDADRRSRQPRALKVISKERCEGKVLSKHLSCTQSHKTQEDLVQNEIVLLQRVQHEHIVRLYDVWNIDGAFYLSLELVSVCYHAKLG